VAHEVTDTSFEEDVVARSADVPVVVDFWADWCGPCHALAPVIEQEVAKHGGAVELVKVDVDANPALSQRFGISGIPAVKGFKDGRVVAEFTGAKSPAAVAAFLDEVLAPPRADGLVEELRAESSLADVIERIDADDLEGALALIVASVPAAGAELREQLRELAVALFERVGHDHPLAVSYRRQLAAALY
jgi:thioredoxin